jgi:hypothetical protein
MEDGVALCVFCCDGLICPVQRRIIAMPRSDRSQWILEQLRKKSQEEPMTTANASTIPAARAPELPARSCSEPGCKAKLAPNNQSGKCREHRSHSKSNGAGAGATAKPAAGNGHAVTSKTNGLDRHPGAHNGNGRQPQIVTERVKMLCADNDLCLRILDAIPVEDKAVMVAAWISGR